MSPFQALKPSDPYYANWLELRRRRKRAWIAFFTWPLVALIMSGILGVIFGPSHGTFLGGGLLAGLVVFGFRASPMEWPCPRCGRPFCRDGFISWPFTDRCLHCGLWEYAPDDPDQRAFVPTCMKPSDEEGNAMTLERVEMEQG